MHCSDGDLVLFSTYSVMLKDCIILTVGLHEHATESHTIA